MSLRDGLFRLLGRGAAERAVLVCGPPRSGTTWLAELIATLPGYKVLNEPLHPEDPGTRTLGLEWRTYMDPEARRPALRAYLEEAFRGRVPGDYLVPARSRPGRLLAMARSPDVVVKMIRAGRMLHWIAATFEVRGIIVVVRHPCAVVASQLSFAGTSENRWARARPPARPGDGFGGRIPDILLDRFAGVLERVRTTEECLAAIWCLDTYCALELHGGCPGRLVRYEGLMLRPDAELRGVFDELRAPVPQRALERLRAPSRVAAPDLRRDAAEQATKWRRNLSPEQARRIMAVVDGFGLGRYAAAAAGAGVRE